MNMEKMKEAFSDEAFVKSLFELETATEVQTALQKKGIDLTEEEILAVRELLIKLEGGEITAEQLESLARRSEDGELSDEALEQVAGGFVVTSMAALTAWFVGSVVVGTAVATGTGVGITFAVRQRW